MRLSYRGAGYHGWQIQPHDTSVQETIEKAMATVLRQPVALTGAGRTDTGVNARLMVAHFDVDEPIADLGLLCHKLNGLVGRDIAIHSIVPVHADAHARFDATSRTYKYFAHTSKSPFFYPLSWHCRADLDFALMNEAAARLLEYRDFTSFSKLHTDVKTNLCHITHARWEREGEQWVFTITADRFLRNMVRAIVGTLVDVGRGHIDAERFEAIIEARNRAMACSSAPAQGLYLTRVDYPAHIFAT